MLSTLSGIASDNRRLHLNSPELHMHEAAYHSETGQRMPAHLPTPLSWRVSLWVCAALFHSPTHAIEPQINRHHYFISLLFPRPKVVSEVLFTWPCLSRAQHPGPISVIALPLLVLSGTLRCVPLSIPPPMPCPTANRTNCCRPSLFTVHIAAVFSFSVYLYFMIYLALI